MHDYSVGTSRAVYKYLYTALGTSRKHAKSRTGHNADIYGAWHGIRVIETSQFSTNTNMTPLPMSADEHKQARTQKFNDSYFTVD